MAVWVFSPGLSQEASLGSFLIWPGRPGLGARCAPPPSTYTHRAGGRPGHPATRAGHRSPVLASGLHGGDLH